MDIVRRRKLEQEVRREAEALLVKSVSAPEFSERIFGPDGILRRLWTTTRDRQRLIASALYRELQAHLAYLRRREAAAFDRDVRAFSGRLTVVVPKSLHASLKREAVFEGVSLSELIRLKLGVAYRFIVRLAEPPAMPTEAAAARRR